MDNLALIEYPNLTVMPAQEIIGKFLNNQRSVKTSKTYGIAIRTFFAWTGGKSFRNISSLDALNYNEYLKNTCAEATVQNRVSTLNQFFKFAKKGKLIQDNPFSIVKQKNVPNRANERFLTVKELDDLLEELYKYKKPQRYVAGLLLASFGPRISEVVGLDHCSFLELPEDENGDPVFAVNLLRKGNERQIIPLRPDVWEVVRDFMGHDPNSSDKRPLLTNPSGDRITDVTLRNWIYEAVEKAGIEKHITVHWLRHSAATHLLDQGQSIENVGWLLGHKSIRTTAIYTHHTNERIAESMPIKVKRKG